MKFNRSLGLLVVFCVGSAWAQSKIGIDSFTGNLSVNGSPYGGGELTWGDQLSLGANESSSSAVLKPGTQAEFDAYRSMLKFSASSVAADYMLPSDRLGGMSAAASMESRVFGTWNNDCMTNSDSHRFGMSLEEFNGDDASIDVDIQEAPKPSISGTTGSFTVGGLDGSAVDLDPRVGFIKIDKSVTPSFAMTFATPDISFTRPDLMWADGTSQASIFHDTSWNGAWAFFEQTSGGSSTHIFSADSLDRYHWMPGDGAGTISRSSYADVLNMDFSQMAVGTYSVKHWSIGWWGIGNTEESDWNCAFGGITQEIVETNIQIVPEPSSFAVIALGAGMFLRLRRAKARN